MEDLAHVVHTKYGKEAIFKYSLKWATAVEATILPCGTDSQDGGYHEVEGESQIGPVCQPDGPRILHFLSYNPERRDEQPRRYVSGRNKTVRDKHDGRPAPLQHNASSCL